MLTRIGVVTIRAPGELMKEVHAMTTLLKKAGLGVALAATALTTAVPAQAQYHRYYRHGGGDAAGAALVGGLAGIAIGAAIASNDRDRDVYYRDRGYRPDYDAYYYRSHGFYPADGYYAYHYRGYGHCWTERRWDPYVRHHVPIRVCS
jgi:hypothetical protein